MNRDESMPERTPGADECSNCGTRLQPATQFCHECGTPVAKLGACPSCGETLQSGERFCRYCGTQVAAFLSGRTQPSANTQAGTTPPDQPEDERPSFNSPPAEDDLRSAITTRSSPPLFTPAAIDCPRCGARGGIDDAFCNSCGLPFDEREPLGSGVQQDVTYAGVLVRIAARIIDIVILSSIFLAIFLIFGTDPFFVIENEVPKFTPLVSIMGATVSWTYHAGLIALWSATPGKRVMGIRVVPATGSYLGFGKPMLREAVIQAPSLLSLAVFEPAGLLSPMLLAISVLIALSRPDHRMLHDLVAGTAVVRDRP